MTNFEYYIKGGRADEGWTKFYDTSHNRAGTTTIDKYNNWLLEEHEEPILDDVEKEYLSNIIKPFKKKVVYIVKSESRGSYFIEIAIKNNGSVDYACLPNFSHLTEMYVNMKPRKKYTLKELGL